VKEFLKSVNIWWKYKHKFGGMFFRLTVYFSFTSHYITAAHQCNSNNTAMTLFTAVQEGPRPTIKTTWTSWNWQRNFLQNIFTLCDRVSISRRHRVIGSVRRWMNCTDRRTDGHADGLRAMLNVVRMGCIMRCAKFPRRLCHVDWLGSCSRRSSCPCPSR